MSKGQRAEQVMRADKRLRLIAIAVCFGGALVGTMAIQWALPWGQRYLEQQEPRTALRTMQMVTGIVFLSVVPFALYLYWLGRRVVASRRLPPPGVKVIRNTRILEGDLAVTRGRTILVLAVILLGLGLVGGLYFPYRLGKLFGPKPQGRSSAQVEQTPPAATR